MRSHCLFIVPDSPPNPESEPAGDPRRSPAARRAPSRCPRTPVLVRCGRHDEATLVPRVRRRPPGGSSWACPPPRLPPPPASASRLRSGAPAAAGPGRPRTRRARPAPRFAYVGTFTSERPRRAGRGAVGVSHRPGVAPLGARPVARPRSESVLSRRRSEAPGALRGALGSQPGVGVLHQRDDGRADADQPSILRRRQPRAPGPRRHGAVPRRRQLRLRLGGRVAGRRAMVRWAAGRISSPSRASSARTGPSSPCRIPITAHSTRRAASSSCLTRASIASSCSRWTRPEGVLVPADPPSVKVRSGAGPRHIGFNPRLPYAYVINELDSTVATFRFTGSGTLEPLQIVPSIPATFTGDNTGAAIDVAPSGRFVYVSNRGHDSIGIFRVDESTGLLSPVAWEPTKGATPRFIGLDPSGRAALRREPARRHHRGVRRRLRQPARSRPRAASSWPARPCAWCGDRRGSGAGWTRRAGSSR